MHTAIAICIMVTSMAEVRQVLLILPQSLTVWSTGNRSLPFFDPVDLPLTVSISDEEVQPLQLPEIVRTAQGSAKKTPPTHTL